MNTLVAQQLPNLERYGVESGSGMLKGPEADNQMFITGDVASSPGRESEYIPRSGFSRANGSETHNHSRWGTTTIVAVAGGLLTAACSAAPSAIEAPEPTLPTQAAPSASETAGVTTEAKLAAAGFQNIGKALGLGSLWVVGDETSKESPVSHAKAVAYMHFGTGVNKQALGKTYNVSVDGKPIPVTLTVPEDDVIRAYVVYGKQGESFTDQGFDDKGKMIGAVGKISVSLAGDSPGPFVTTATEICQGLNMKGVNVLKAQETYRLSKEALCNSLGLAADRAALNRPYEEYVADAKSQRFENVADGHDLRATVFSKQFYQKAVIAEKQIKS